MRSSCFLTRVPFSPFSNILTDNSSIVRLRYNFHRTTRVHHDPHSSSILALLSQCFRYRMPSHGSTCTSSTRDKVEGPGLFPATIPLMPCDMLTLFIRTLFTLQETSHTTLVQKHGHQIMTDFYNDRIHVQMNGILARSCYRA